jgi:hypothetical protein
MLERALPAVTCTNHCGSCHRHFHSLDAFDAHHRRDEEGWVVCLDPVDLVDLTGKDRLEALTEHGECRMYTDVQRNVTIWTVAGSREKAARWRARASESPSAAA